MFFFNLLLLFTPIVAKNVATVTYCGTKLGPKSTSPVPTSTVSSSTLYTASRNTTVRSTVTITPSTTRTIRVTTTVFSTTGTATAGSSTQTFTETATEYNSVTIVDDPTAYVTSTSYVPFTSTLAPSGLFVPIKSDGDLFAPPNYPKVRRALATGTGVGNTNGTDVTVPTQYPQRVNCKENVKNYTTVYFTVTASPRSTTLLPSSTTSTKTVTSTVSATGKATTTVTITTTIATPIFIPYPGDATTWTTATDTTLPAATAFAQCNQDNNLQITDQRGLSIPFFIGYQVLNSIPLDIGTSWLDCCNICATTTGCASSVWSSAGYFCYILTTSSTSPTVPAPNGQYKLAGKFYSQHVAGVGSSNFQIQNGVDGVMRWAGDVCDITELKTNQDFRWQFSCDTQP